MKNKKHTIALIIFLSILVLLIIGIMIFLMSGKFKFNFKNGSDELKIEEVYDLNFDEINIITDAGDVYLKNYDDDKVKLLIYNDDDLNEVNINGNILDIDVKNKKCHFFCNNKIAKIEIYLPNNYENEINIEDNLGNIEVENFEKINVNIKNNLGDIDISNVNNAIIKNDLGDVNINKVNNADIKVSSGDVNIKEVNDIKIKTNLGDVVVNKINNYLDISNDCGDIKLDKVVLNKDSKIQNSLGDVKINNIKDVYIDGETDLGKVKINNNYRNSDITLEIENNCGDIKVDN